MSIINPSQRAISSYPTDDRWMFWDGMNFRPYLTVAEANAAIPLSKRHVGLFANVAGDLYWYKDGVNLILFGTKATWGAITGNMNDQTDLSAALDGKADLVDGKVPADQLPSFVDDVLEFPNLDSFPAIGEEGIIYVALDTNNTYRWGGNVYIMVGSGQNFANADLYFTGDRTHNGGGFFLALEDFNLVETLANQIRSIATWDIVLTNTVNTVELAPSGLNISSTGAITVQTAQLVLLSIPQDAAAPWVLGVDDNGQVKKRMGTGLVADATATTKGVIQLAGDLSGTAAAPTVPGKADKSVTLTINGVTQDISTDRTWTIDMPTDGWTIAAGKTPVINNSLTLNGMDGTAHTFPSSNSVVARTDAAQTFTGNQTVNARVGVGIAPFYAKVDMGSNVLGTLAVLAFRCDNGPNNPRAILNHVTSATSQYVEFTGAFSSGSGMPNWAFTNGSVVIGITTPATNAILDINSTIKGVLFPRMTTAQKNAIASPANGLMVYDTSINRFSVYENTAWVAHSGGWSMTGNAITDPAVNFIGTTDNQPFTFRVNNVPVSQFGSVGFRYGDLTTTIGALSVYFDGTGIEFKNSGNYVQKITIGVGESGLLLRDMNTSAIKNVTGTVINTTKINAYKEGQTYTPLTIQANPYPGEPEAIVFDVTYPAQPKRMIIYGGNSTNAPVSIIPDGNGSLIVGADNTAKQASAVFNAISTNKGALIPRMTTAQKNAIASPANGLMVYDTSLNKLCVYEFSAWAVSGSGGGSSTDSWTIAAGKTPAINNSLTLNGTDGTTMTFPATSATIARTDAAQTFTGIQTITDTDTVIGASGATLLALNQTWNTTGSPTAIKLFVTDTASNGNSSRLIDLFVNGTSVYRVHKSGATIIGSGTTELTALLNVASTSQGALMPRMTTAQKTAIGSPAEGLEVYDLTLHQKSVFNGTIWDAGQTFASSITIAGLQTTAGTTNGNIFIPSSNILGTSYSVASYITNGNPIQFRVGIRGSSAAGVQANADVFALAIGDNTFTKQTTGTHNLAGGLYVKTQSHNAGASTLVDFQNVYIGDTPVGGTNNWALNTGSILLRSGAGGANSGLRIAQSVNHASPSSSYVAIDLAVAVSGVVGQLFATASNYAAAGVNIPLHSVALSALAGSLCLFAYSGSAGDIRFTTGGMAAANERMRITPTGSIGIGQTAPAASAILDVASTIKGALLPRMTTAQKNAIGSPAEGLEVYDMDLHKKSYYNGTAWINI